MENETKKSDESGNLHKPLVGSSVCPLCNGDGFTSEHYPHPHEYGDCGGMCPIQVQCEECKATGFVTNEELVIINRNLERIKSQQVKWDKNTEMPF